MSRGRSHIGPSPAEREWLELSDAFYFELERRGERAAMVFAKRALYAAQGDDMDHTDEIEKILRTTPPDQIIAGLRALRNAAELEGDMNTADLYEESIRNVMEAADAGAIGGDTAPADDLTQKMYRAPARAIGATESDRLSVMDGDEPDAMKRDKAIRQGQADFTKAYKQQHAADIRKRPAGLDSHFAQSPARANPVAPQAPAPDTQKLAKRQVETAEETFKRTVAAQIRESMKR